MTRPLASPTARSGGEGGADSASPSRAAGPWARRWVPRLGVVTVVLACTATVVITLQDRADVVAAEEASLVSVAEDANATAGVASEVDDLSRQLDQVRQQGATDVRGARRAGEVSDHVLVLRVRLEDAQAAVLDSRTVSAEQRVQLAALRGCVDTLDTVRASLAGRDVRAATLALAAGRGACSRAEEISDGITDAVHPFDFPDPDVIEVGGTYYAYGTNGPGGTIQVLSSPDLADWQVRGSALKEVAPWAKPGLTWAPAVIRGPDGFLLYYSVRHAQWGQQCISVAKAASPAGPFVDASWAPITCQTDYGGSIDPSPYYGQNGSIFLTWKSEGETVAQRAALWAARLDRFGTAISGPTIPLTSTERVWEGQVVEAPTMAHIDGTWVLLYSGNDWRTDRYATGYALCLGPLGPCGRPDGDNLVLRSGERVKGPGGPSVFTTPDGRTMVAYAGWDADQVGPPNPRRLHISEIHLTDGRVTAG